MTETKNFDAVIVGAGPGGGAVAFGLCKRGWKVLLIDAGPSFSPEHDYKLDQVDWEAQMFPHKEGSQGSQGFGPGQKLSEKWDHLRSWTKGRARHNPGATRLFAAYHHVRGIGGSTLHFTGEAHRLNPKAMKMKTDFGVGADWPFDYAALEPWYGRAEEIIGVAGDDGFTGGRPRSTAFPMPAHSPGYAAQTLGRAMEALGLSSGANSLAVLSRPRGGRPECNYCNNCNRGCPRRDKGSADVTTIEQALATGNLEIRPRTALVSIVKGEGDQIKEIVVANKRGALSNIPTAVLVLACGAVETPRALLASNMGNESGLVGKNFMETLSFSVSALHPQPQASQKGLPSSIISWDFNAPDSLPGIPGGFRLTPSAAESDLVGPMNTALRAVEGWGRAHKKKVRENFGHILSMGAIGESLPNEKSFISLDESVRDENGVARAKIHSYLDETAIRRIDAMAGQCHAVLKAAGCAEAFEQYGSYDFFSSTHVFGTCRMGTSEAESVVNPQGRHHRWKNLYISDASIFPSSGGGEAPSLSIAALSLRLADHLAGR